MPLCSTDSARESVLIRVALVVDSRRKSRSAHRREVDRLILCLSPCLRASVEVSHLSLLTMLPQTLLIDADDTLWENNVYFEQAIADFIERLNHQHLSPDEVRAFLI